MSQPEPGWYPAAGDPPGTQRYWNGTEWQGDPVPVAPGTGGPTPPPFAQGGFASSAPGVVPPGYVAFEQASAVVQTPASWGRRLAAYLLDLLPLIGIYVVGIGLALALEGVGFLLLVVAVFGYMIWNLIIRQGRTGQSIGKSNRNIKLVKIATGEPPGAGIAFARLLVATVLSNFSFGIYGLLDYLWPLWDKQNQRLTDKMFSLSVIEV